jgi:hypothetical protein
MTFERHISCKFPTSPIHDDMKQERCKRVVILHTALFREIIPGQRMVKGNTSVTAHLSKVEIMAYTGHDPYSS